MFSVNRMLGVGFCVPVLLLLVNVHRSSAQDLQRTLAAESPARLAADARELGDPQRGAIVFYQPFMACTKCHTPQADSGQLGPELAKMGSETTAEHIIESILHPSKVIKKGFQTVVVLTDDGKTFAGLLIEENDTTLVLADPGREGKPVRLAKSAIEDRNDKAPSIMPEGLVNQLSSRQQFLDLVCYLVEIAQGGAARELALKPAPSLYAARPLPEYEQHIDHAGMIASLNGDSYRRGEAIYSRVCANCHGTHRRPGSLPTSLRFATGKFKNGNDPFTMYQTLTRGFGMMVPQAWMVPQQKYDVIHYIREAYLKRDNPSQYFAVDGQYLDGLPEGDTRGPAPSNILPWTQMDYGPNLVATYEIGDDASNFAYKGNAVRLDAGQGGVSRGRHWMVFDFDTMRMAAAWSGKGFIDWNGINFNGRHNIHPRIVGDVTVANPNGPGWANPADGRFEDPRLQGRDGRRYGPLPRDWAKYRGMYYHGNNVLVEYTVGGTTVLEMPAVQQTTGGPVFLRTLNIGPRDEEMILQVAHRPGPHNVLRIGSSVGGSEQLVLFGPPTGKQDTKHTAAANTDAGLKFDGSTFIEVDAGDRFDLTGQDFTIVARIKTKADGTILCKTAKQNEWVRDGKTLFIRGGRLVYDIGWVGAVVGKRRVNDDRWHDVAMRYEQQTGRVQLMVDGELDAEGTLKPKASVTDHVVRIGYTNHNFPRPESFFQGDLANVQFYQRRLSEAELAAAAREQGKSPLAHWRTHQARDSAVADRSGNDLHGSVRSHQPALPSSPAGVMVAGIAGSDGSLRWQNAGNDLRLHIPAGKSPLRFTLWMAQTDGEQQTATIVDEVFIDQPERDLTAFTAGGPRRWPEKLTTHATLGNDDGPFAVDTLTAPFDNPWFCRMRLTGFDFFPGGDRAAVCAWDGSVWLVDGLASLQAAADAGRESAELTWQRIASGLFQPLGLKIVAGKIHVTCRDQLCVLHDLNGDEEIDYFECLNNDHQVTDHFHEFAMGLQTDAEGNFYYAKSARHALKAVVPHHGTLLRITKDGSRTDILATGFRAANGVCLNPDGTFIVTDQEGHWNPKNRINWVREGGFYGNMFGYHDVTDPSDEAMEQPLCWITNSFDRSPAELLWVEGQGWGPLSGSLLNLSYGYGKIYVVPHETVDGQVQGGMCELPIPSAPTGLIRGRFHPRDGQLYTCGMFAWAGSQQEPGGFYRVRYTGKPVHLPIGLNAVKDGVRLRFSGELDRATAVDASRYAVKTWGLKRTASYGSKHYDEKSLEVTRAELSEDRRTVTLRIPDIQPTWCMEIRYNITAPGGKPVDGVIHNTIHHLGKE